MPADSAGASSYGGWLESNETGLLGHCRADHELADPEAAAVAAAAAATQKKRPKNQRKKQKQKAKKAAEQGEGGGGGAGAAACPSRPAWTADALNALVFNGYVRPDVDL